MTMNHLFAAIGRMADEGLGYEDICVKLRLRDKHVVKRMVFARIAAREERKHEERQRHERELRARTVYFDGASCCVVLVPGPVPSPAATEVL